MTAELLPPEPEREVARHGDLLYFVDTGEVCGLVRPKGWEPTSLDDVEFLLGILDREQVEAQALRRRAGNLQAQAERHDRTVGFLRGRYAAAVARVVREHLPRGRWSLESREGYGALQWRRRSKRIDVTDEAAAIAWASEHCPDAVKREVSLVKTRLPEDAQVPGVARFVPSEDDRYLTWPEPK